MSSSRCLPSTRIAPLAACALGLLSVAANCEQCQEATDLRKGNLDRAADVVLITSTLDSHTYAIVSNPELEHLRVFDLTVESFVDSPNGYFPLSIDVGPDTRKLALSADEQTLFALDGAADTIFVVDTSNPRAATTVDSIATARAPADIAVVDLGAPEDRELWVTLPDEGCVQIFDAAGNEIAHVQLTDRDGVRARPSDIVVDPQGESVVVADAAQPVLHVFSRGAGADPHAVERVVDVGGSVGGLAAGVIDIGDGLSPVVLALLRDQPVAVAVRLFRGVAEERYQVLGSAEIPGRPLSAYVPDHRVTKTVCCRELTNDLEDAGEATDSWAAVGTADGRVVYLSIVAVDGLVRIFDNDLGELAEGEALTSGWVPEAGDEDREPASTVEATGAFGDPPFVPLLDPDEQITLVWEGARPGITRARVKPDDGDLLSESGADFEARGGEIGDVAIIALENPEPGCPAEIEASVTGVQVSRVRVELADPDDEACLTGGGQLRLSLAPAQAFIATDRDGDFLGVVGFGEELPLSGGDLRLAPSAAGPPEHRGSTLVVPIDAHVAVIDLDLSDAVSFLASDGGGFGQAAILPVAIAGREMQFPGVELGTLVTGRRMVIATGANDSNGLNALFTCDEGETIPGLCVPFR